MNNSEKFLIKFFKSLNLSQIEISGLMVIIHKFKIEDKVIDSIENNNDNLKMNYYELLGLITNIIKDLPNTDGIGENEEKVIGEFESVCYSRKSKIEELDVVYDGEIWGDLLLLGRLEQGKLELNLNFSLGTLAELENDTRFVNKNIEEALLDKIEVDDFDFRKKYQEIEKKYLYTIKLLFGQNIMMQIIFYYLFTSLIDFITLLKIKKLV